MHSRSDRLRGALLLLLLLLQVVRRPSTRPLPSAPSRSQRASRAALIRRLPTHSSTTCRRVEFRAATASLAHAPFDAPAVQPRELYRRVMTDAERAALVANVSGHMAGATPAVRVRGGRGEGLCWHATSSHLPSSGDRSSSYLLPRCMCAGPRSRPLVPGRPGAGAQDRNWHRSISRRREVAVHVQVQ